MQTSITADALTLTDDTLKERIERLKDSSNSYRRINALSS